MKPDPLAILFEIPGIAERLSPFAETPPDAELVRATPCVVVLGDLDGMAIFYYEGKQRYDGHYVFPPWTRGKDALARARKFIDEMFDKHGAMTISGVVPRDHRAARLMSRALGFIPAGETADCHGRPAVVYRLERARWAELSAVSDQP